jgi:predicted site-specific integrase-resolvase
MSNGKLESKSSFEERFNISVNYDDAKKKFTNRVENVIWLNMSFKEGKENDKYINILWDIANEFGEIYYTNSKITDYTKQSFTKTLHALEVAYSVLSTKKKKKELQQRIEYCLELSEIDLGVQWRNGIFIKTGAKELDETLINDVLEWLDEKEYRTVSIPFTKGIRLLIEAVNNEEKRRDVIRDMYEALEALSMIITGRTKKDLSSNMEKYLSQAKISDEYRRIFKEYIVYANRIRHATGKNDNLFHISYREVESFVYLTGIFIRISM